MHAVLFSIVATFAVTADDPAAGRSGAVVIELAAGPHERRDTPVYFPVSDDRAWKLTHADDGRVVESQVLPGTPPSLVWILRDPLPAGAGRVVEPRGLPGPPPSLVCFPRDRLPAGATRRYRLEPAREAGAGRGGVTSDDDGEHIKLKVGDRPVLQYNAAMVESPRGIEPYYRRNGQIHPLFTPSGGMVTDDFPPDHAHQHGVFFAWVNTTFERRHLDFWNQKEQTGGVRHVATLGTASGPVFGEFRVKLRHDDLSAPGGPRPVLDEVWTVRAYALKDVFLVDFESTQSCAGADPLTINKYHYGGMGLRGNREWFDPTVKGNDAPDPARSGRSDFLTDEGKDRGTGNHTRPRWVDLSGKIDAGSGGVALLDHPGNFRFPQPIRLHPNKPYFCFAPMVLGSFEIAPGRPYLSRYRIVVHDGPPDAGALGRFWNDYADPPAVRVVTDR